MDSKPEINRDELIRLHGVFNLNLDNMLKKVNALISKNRGLTDENHQLMESVKDLNNKITELKLQLNKINSDSLFKEKEISDLKNLLLSAEKSTTNIRDKEFVRSRLKELISRIDVHLEQYEDQAQDFED
jgi:chromosome segregation ATPase